MAIGIFGIDGIDQDHWLATCINHNWSCSSTSDTMVGSHPYQQLIITSHGVIHIRRLPALFRMNQVITD